jgi:hypothetical protein
VLLFAGRAIDTETMADVDGLPTWIDLPAMMKMRMSTPHYLDQMKGKASPFGFVLHPRTRDRLKLTLLTPFSKKREGWVHALCVNTHDGKVYRLEEFPDADVISLGDILCGYVNHPEIKSNCTSFRRLLLLLLARLNPSVRPSSRLTICGWHSLGDFTLCKRRFAFPAPHPNGYDGLRVGPFGLPAPS